MKQLKCAICADKQRLRILFPVNLGTGNNFESLFSARRLPDRIHYQINKCLRCGLIFSSPILENQKLNKFYKKSNFNYQNLTKYISQTYINYFNKYMYQYLKDAKVLDIGCGNGFFLKALNKSGFKNVYGVEPSISAVNKAGNNFKKNIKVSFFKKGLFPKNSFDIVTSFHTLDHVENPQEFIQNARQILNKNGAIYIIVHNTDGLSVKLFGEKSPIFDIEHIYLFNKNTLKKLLKMNGFKDIKVFDIKNSYPLDYWLRMIPLPLILKTKILKLLHIFKLGKIEISLKAGNIGAVGFVV